MLSEDRLDALLSVRIGMRQQRPGTPLDTGDDPRNELQPLIDAADRVAELANQEPAEDFVAHLEGIFLSRAAYLRKRHGIEPPSLLGELRPLPLVETPSLIGNDDPTLPGIEWSVASNDATLPDAPPIARPFVLRRRPEWRRLLWPALAAILLLTIGMSTLTAAALARPGSPLYGLHKWEQNLQEKFTGSAATRTQLHISNAQNALFSLDSAMTNHQTGTTYDGALATFQDEMRAAATNLDGVPAGGNHDALSAQLDQLQATGIADLYTALPALSWSQRIKTTGVLAEIGDQVLTVTRANMVYSSNGQNHWTITVSGSGFWPGAVLLVNGQPAGTVLSVTPTKLVAQISGDDSTSRPGRIGVGNPDNTAATTTSINGTEQNENATSNAQPTPTGDDPSSGGGNGGSGGGGQDGDG